MPAVRYHPAFFRDSLIKPVGVERPEYDPSFRRTFYLYRDMTGATCRLRVAQHGRRGIARLFGGNETELERLFPKLGGGWDADCASMALMAVCAEVEFRRQRSDRAALDLLATR
jgi:hypothetical protein